MLKIHHRKIKDTTIAVPGSKSYTHRTFIAAALSDGQCTISNWLDSEDTNYTLSALKQFGAPIEKRSDQLMISGRHGKMDPLDTPIHLGNSGTSMRLLTAYAAIGRGKYVLTGSERMHERPIQDLLDGLQQVGVHAISKNKNGCPPVEVIGDRIVGGTIHLNCGVSSQFLSGLLLIAPYTDQGLKIIVTQGPVSKPYIDITIDIMSRFGVDIIRDGHHYFEVPGSMTYRSGNYIVEPDCSQAGYFWAAAAITGTAIKVLSLSKESKQGDLRFIEVLASMGCKVFHETDGIKVAGGKLSAVEVDMADMPDLVPTLAVVAAFAEGTTVIKNVSHLKIKESDRLSAVINELTKMGISAVSKDSNLLITGGSPHGATIDTYDDHRIAMSFAVGGLMTPGITILNEGCVKKSFPDFWDVFNRLYQ